jgi:hypothetical protein
MVEKAEELDVDFSKIIIEQADLDTKHFTRQFIGGSQAIHQGWQPLRMAGATARQMLREAAAQKLSIRFGVPLIVVLLSIPMLLKIWQKEPLLMLLEQPCTAK